MDYMIREMKKSEYPLLREFLYKAIFIPEGVKPPPRSIVDLPELRLYIADFGKCEHDRALVAEGDNMLIGAIWVRIMNDYGHIDDETPSFAMSVREEYRNSGVGTELMKNMLSLLGEKGYKKASLSVQKANYAVRLYEKAGFEIFGENDEEYIMVKYL